MLVNLNITNSDVIRIFAIFEYVVSLSNFIHLKNHMMSDKSILICQSEILKGLGHKSRTLLSGITGPIQIIKSLSDEPKLIEPLRILELSISRFERFSLRSLMLSNLLQNRKSINPKPLGLIDTFRYVVLDFTDLLDFFNVNIEINNNSKSINVISDHDLLSHCVMVLFEQIISLSDENTSITVEFIENAQSVGCYLLCSDNGLVYKSFNNALFSDSYPNDIDLHLLKYGLEVLNANLNLTLTSGNHTKITLELPYTYHHE